MVVVKKDILNLGKGPMQGLHDARLAAEAEYCINYNRKGMERK